MIRFLEEIPYLRPAAVAAREVLAALRRQSPDLVPSLHHLVLGFLEHVVLLHRARQLFDLFFSFRDLVRCIGPFLQQLVGRYLPSMAAVHGGRGVGAPGANARDDAEEEDAGHLCCIKDLREIFESITFQQQEQVAALSEAVDLDEVGAKVERMRQAPWSIVRWMGAKHPSSEKWAEWNSGVVPGRIGEFVRNLGARLPLPSDRRLKRRIRRLGRFAPGLGWYAFEWNDVARRRYGLHGPGVGVLSQEVRRVLPRAVVRGLGDRYDHVDWAALLRYHRRQRQRRHERR